MGKKTVTGDLNEIVSQYLKCNIHSKNLLQYYCKDDKRLCCELCRKEEHTNCRNVTNVDTIAIAEDAKTEIKKLQTTISKLSDFIETMIDARNANIAEQKKETAAIIPHIKALRQKVDRIFDALEARVNKATETLKNDCKSAAIQEAYELREKKALLSQMSCLLDNVLENRNISQPYVIVKKIEEQFRSCEANILDIN